MQEPLCELANYTWPLRTTAFARSKPKYNIRVGSHLLRQVVHVPDAAFRQALRAEPQERNRIERHVIVVALVRETLSNS